MVNNISVLRFFWSHIKPYKWYYFVMISAPLIASFYPFIYNYAIKLFLDAMTEHKHISYMLMLYPILLFLVSQLVIEIAWQLSSIAQWMSTPYVRRSILLRSFNDVQHHSYLFFQNNLTGAISSKIKGILDGYDKFWAEMHYGLLLKIIQSIVNILALSFLNYYLGLVVLSWSIVYIAVMYKLSKKLNIFSYNETESRHALIAQVSDKISNIFSLFAFSARRRELSMLAKQVNTDFIPKQIKTYKYDFFVQLISGCLYILMFSLLLFYMIHLRMIGAVSIGDFAFVFGITIVISEDIWQATISLQDFARSMGDLKSSLSILSPINEGKSDGKIQLSKIIQPTVDFKDVSFSYDNRLSIIKDLNLNIKSGEKIGLVGHSGAGKSSLISLLLRYHEVSRGVIYLDGHNIAEVTKDSLREHISVIPQDTMLFHRSLMENIRFGKPDASNDEVFAAARKAHIHEFILTLPERYKTLVGERGIKLSAGQRQRIAIARAILKNAPILILDEATSSLDSYTEKLIQDSLNFFIKNSGKTVIAVAHRLSTLKHMDRIIVLDKGCIVEEGTHDELINQSDSLYKLLWRLQDI